MNQNKKLLTRIISLMLSMLMMVSYVGVVQVTALTPENSEVLGVNDGPWSQTTSGLVANSYALNDVEKAILGSAGLAGDIYSVAVPDDSNDGLVSVDADAQVITAVPYETNGFVWVPTLAVVVYSANGAGDAIDVELTKVGDKYIGSFTKPANSYSVRVVYTLSIEVDKDLQKTLVNTPYYLADGYLKLKDAVDGSLAIAVSAINEKMEELRALYNGIKYEATYEGEVVYTYELGFEADSACKTAIGNLIADYDKAENNGRLTLAKDFDDYRAAQSKIKFMLENGAAVKEHINWFYTQLANINANSSEILAIAEKLENLANGTGEGTIADAKNKIDELAVTLTEEANKLLDQKIQTEIIDVVVKTAQDTYGLDISSLSGKTRKDDAIYKEIEAKRVYFISQAEEAEKSAAWLLKLGNTSKAEELLAAAKLIREDGIKALDDLEAGIREAYRLGDEAINEKVDELKAKKTDLDAMGTTALEKAADIREIVTGANGGIKLSQVVNTVKNYRNQTWDYIGKTLVRDDITDEQYLALDSVVKTAIDPIYDELLVFEHDDFEIKDSLYATETEISSLVEQYSVHVDVKASVVPKNTVNSADLASLEVESSEFPLDKNTPADKVIEHIDITNVEYTALDRWDSYYNINTDNYNRTVTVTDKDGNEISDFDALDCDIVYTIEYTPKQYTITETYKAAGEDKTVVPYGYNWRLPRPDDISKSYDYEVDGVSYLESSIVRVTKNISASRKEGKALIAKSVAELIAMSKTPGSQLSAKELAILNTGAFNSDTVYYRTPENKDALATVEDADDGYKVVAKTMTAGIVGSEAVWTPVSVVPVYATGNGAPVVLAKNGDVYEATFAYGGQLLNVNVTYQLSIDTIGADTVSKFVNVGSELVAAAGMQKGALDTLCTQNNFYKNLEQVTSTVLGTVGSAVPNMSATAKAALNELTSLCINSNTTYTYLYEYLTQYMSESGGLAYLYKGQNAANIIKQINLVNKNLPIVWKDAAVQAYINSMAALASQSQKIEAVMAQLASTNVPPVNALVNTNSSFVDNLIAAVTASGETSTHENVSGTIVLEETLTAAAPGQMSYAVEVEVLDKNDNFVRSYKTERFVPKNTVVKVAEFEEMYNALVAQIANAQYYVADKDLPAEDVKVTGDVTFVSSLRPVSYTVKIDGESDQTIYAFDAYTINLPGTGVNGFKYIYNVGNKTQEVGTGTLENYSLGTNIADIDALFGADRELVITRELVDINKDNFIKFIGDLNKAFKNAGFDGATFVPFEDNNGNLSIVLRVTSTDTTLSANALASELVSIVKNLSYVGLNNNMLFGLNSDNEVKLYVQSIINMIANSGLGIDTLFDITDENGKLKEFKLGGVTVVDGFTVDNLNKLGAKIIETSMQYGVNVNNATSVPLYVTYQDYGTQADLLKKARLGAKQIAPFIDLTCKDGAVNMTLNLPDSVYAYFVSALLAVGEIDFETIQSYDLAQIVEYCHGLIAPMFNADGVVADTFINTVEKAGLYKYISGYDSEANKALFDFLYNGLDHLFDSTEITGSSVGGAYSGMFKYDALDVLFNKKPAAAEYSNMVAEVDTGLELAVNFNLKNRDVEYQALILDINVEDTISNPKENLGGIMGGKDEAIDFAKKYHLTRNVASEIAHLSEGAIVVMLSDVHSDITVNKDVIINLNGYSINGDITSKATTTIVDSTLNTAGYGSVTGDLIANGGTFKLGSGKFSSSAEQFIDTGYYIENNVVTNGCYSIEKDGEDLNVYLGTEYLSLDRPAAKIMATDIVFKLLMNYYKCSQFTVDSDVLYKLDLLNVTDALDNLSSLIDQVLDGIDTEGCSNFATKFMQDVTDFEAIAQAIDNKTAVAEYSITNYAFEPYMTVEGKGKNSFLSLNVKAGQDKQITNLNVYVANEVDADKRAKMSEILRELDAISTIEDIDINIDSIKYANKSFDVKGSASANVEVDLTNDVNYPVIIAAIVADGIGGKYKTELVNAIKNYQTNNDINGLKTSLEKLTVAQTIIALKATRNKSFANILNSLGLKAADAVELESLYAIARKVAGTVLEFSKKHGNDAKLGAFKVSGEYGTYAYDYENGKDACVSLVLKLFTESKDITVKNKDGVITMNTDDIAAALESVTAGSTVYVNAPVVLSKDVTLPAVEFSVVNGQNINFGGYKLWFDNTYTKLTIDSDISSYVDFDETIFCSEIERTEQEGKYVFALVGEQHEWVDIPAVDPTCDTDGSTAGVWCKHCHKYQDGKQPQKVDRLGHNYVETVVEATCTTEGYTLHTCSNCQDSYKTNIVPAKNHSGTTEIIPGKEATCTEDGLTDGLKCTECNEILEAQRVIPADHKPVDANSDATCTEHGYSGKTVCSVCGVVINEGTEIPAKGHTVAVVQGTAPTCDSTGLTAGAYCPDCDHVFVKQEIIAKLDHKVVIDPAVEATCTKTGLTEGSHCAICDKVLEEQIVTPFADHTPVVDPAVEATCTKTGLTEGSHCKFCDKVLVAQQETPVSDHKGIVVPAVEATCTTTGLTEGSNCKFCDKVLVAQQVTDMIDHVAVIDKAVEPTCTKTGLTAGSHCKFCDKVIIAQQVVDMLDHKVVVDKAVEATCTKTGLTEGSHCAICDKVIVEQNEVAKKPHITVTDRGIEATCTSTGITEGSHCSACGEVFVAQTEIPMKEHNKVIDAAVEATCTSKGLTEGSHCKTCDKVFVAQTEVPMKEHNKVTDPARVPTCTMSGLTEGSHCEDCGKVFVAQQDIAVVDHKPVVDKAVAATKDKTGLTEGSHCEVCNKVLVAQKVTAKLPYINVPTVKVDAQGTVRGAKVDATNKYVYLDVAPTGFTVEEFVAVNFKIDNATTTKQTITNRDGSVQRGAKDLVCTGDKVTVWAANADGAQTSVTYNIIVMGDSNCDGKLNARDLVLMKLSFVGDLTLEQPDSTAADMNFDGKINARDAVACETKFLLWSTKQYVSLTK